MRFAVAQKAALALAFLMICTASAEAQPAVQPAAQGVLAHEVAQGRTVDEVHDLEMAAVLEPAEGEHIDDVRVAQTRDQPGLVDEAHDALRLRGALTEDLDRRAAADHGVRGSVDRAEAAAAHAYLEAGSQFGKVVLAV